MGDKIVSKTNQAYRDNFDRVFRKRERPGIQAAVEYCERAAREACKGFVGQPTEPPKTIPWTVKEVSGWPVYKDNGTKEEPFGGTFPDQDSLQPEDTVIVAGLTGWYHATIDRLPSGELFAVTTPGNQSGWALEYSEEQGCWVSYGQVNLAALRKFKLYAPSEPHQVSEPVNDGKSEVWAIDENDGHAFSKEEYPVIYRLSCRHGKYGHVGEHAVGDRIVCEYCTYNGNAVDATLYALKATERQAIMPPDPGLVAKLPDGRTVLMPNGTKIPEGTGIVYGVDWGTGPDTAVEVTAHRAEDGSFIIDRWRPVKVEEKTVAQRVLDEIKAWPDSQRLAFSALFHELAYEATRPHPSTGFLRRILGDDKGADEAIECAKRVSEPFRKGAAAFRKATILAMQKEGLPVYCPSCEEPLVPHQIGDIPTGLCCNNCGATLDELLNAEEASK